MKTCDSKSTKEFKCVFGGRGISRVMWTRTTEQIAHWLVLHMQAYINDLGQTETLPLPTRIHTVEWAHWSKDIHPLKTMGFSYSHCELLSSASFCWVLEIEPRALHVGNRCLNCVLSLRPFVFETGSSQVAQTLISLYSRVRPWTCNPPALSFWVERTTDLCHLPRLFEVLFWGARDQTQGLTFWKDDPPLSYTRASLCELLVKLAQYSGILCFSS